MERLDLPKPDLETILSILSRIQGPSRYLGCEINARKRPWEGAAVRVCLVFPDLYEIGMSHLGLHVLYSIVNSLKWTISDRAYCPSPDLEGLLRRKAIPLWGLESKRPLSEFDVLGITLPYELCFLNIFTILELSGIPFFSRDRQGRSYPLIIGGGSASFNPEPVADLFDAILIGDGEEAIVEILELIRDWKKEGARKDELLKAFLDVPGLYVPSFYAPRYSKSGVFLGMDTKRGAPARIKRRIVKDLEGAPLPTPPIVPLPRIVHDRLGVEIARGCTRGCRFCQAGIIYRPVRERAPGTVIAYTKEALKTTGFDEISLLSLSSGDYSGLEPLVCSMMMELRSMHVAMSLPSLRVGTLTPRIIQEIMSVRKTGFTMAPEAGSERLRRVINKGITEEGLLETARKAYEAGWLTMKLYFMIGLPGETDDDVLAIMRLAKRVKAASKKGNLTVSIGTFIPKPHTPFQWEPQISVSESRRRIRLVQRGKGRGIQVKWHDPWQSYLEGVFSRGDRRLFHVLLGAWRLGARLSAWTDHLDPSYYKTAAERMGLDLDAYLAERDESAPLPWSHIDTGVSLKFLRLERRRAWEEEGTLDCRHGDCQGCGVCDFKSIRPVVHPVQSSLERSISRPAPERKRTSFYYWIRYEKLGVARFLGHLDTIRAIERAARRAGLPIAFSKGFHPHPLFWFEDALPLGYESASSLFSIGLLTPMEGEDISSAFNKELPEGFRVLEVHGPGRTKGLPKGIEHCYLVWMREASETLLKEVFKGGHGVKILRKAPDQPGSCYQDLEPWNGAGPFLSFSRKDLTIKRPDIFLSKALGLGDKGYYRVRVIMLGFNGPPP